MFAVYTSSTALAVPAIPKPITVKQPDGTSITIMLRGDEHLNWAETTDGYTLLRDGQGYLSFAEKDKNGNLVASSVRYFGSSSEAKAMGLTPKLRYSNEQIKEAFNRPLSREFNKKPAGLLTKSTDKSQFLIDGTFPSTGKRKLLVLLVNYSDTQTRYSRQDIQDMMSKENYGGIGSLRDYYLEQSYGKLDLDITVSDWIKLPKPKGTYGADGASTIIYDALSQLSQTLDLKQFDNDGDGILDGLAVIHQGTGQEASMDASDIWSHSSIIYGQTFNGVTVRRYTIEPEINARTQKLQNIGVIAHEFGHALGAPDYYDTDYEASGEFSGTGIWDLLANGAWSGDYGSRPTGVNAWQKWIWGWTEPTLLDESTTITDMPSATDSPVAYRMETGTPGEYFIMENRQNSKGFDYSLPGHGLIIYHVNENLIKSKLFTNDINATYPQGIYAVCSDAGVDPDRQPTSYGNINSSYAPFPGEGGHTEFSDNTLPSAKSLEGRASYRALTDITDVDGKVSFTYTHLSEPAKPEELVATTADGKVNLAWTIENAADIDHYNIYRDNEKIGESKECSYADNAPIDGKTITYQVDAAYKDSRLSHPTSISIMVPTNYITSMTAESVADNTVKLAWNISNELSRANLYSGQTSTTDVYGSTVEYANCYTPADLSNYVGGTITKMAFFPTQGPSELTVKFRIWEGDANGENMTVVSERNVKEFATAQRRELKLTTPVTIKADKTYWISVYNECAKGVASVICDNSSNLVRGRGNCVIINNSGDFEPCNEATGNFYISATMTLPSATTGTDFAVAPSKDFDLTTDLAYPLCYVIHRDNTPVVYTTKREKTLTGEPAGSHIYAVSSYYNGGNESTRISETITVSGSTDGIDDAGASQLNITRQGEFIVINGYRGVVTISDAAGLSRTYNVDESGNAILLNNGINIIKVGKEVFKAIK